MNLSVIILTKNEEGWIEGALKSALFADEIVVIDSGSTDNTLKIARKYRAKIYSSRAKSFSAWRNLGLRKAKGKWIFYLDADERIAPKLKEELKEIISTSESGFDSYVVPRKNFYLGYLFRYCHSYPDYQHRFFRKKALLRWEKPLHETPVLAKKQAPGKLQHPLWHFTHRDIASMLEKTNKWSLIEAKELLAANHPPMRGWRFFSVLGRSFWKQFICFQCWRDGTKGIIEGLFQVFSNFISYAKLWELQQEKRAPERYEKLEKELLKQL